MDKIVKGNVDSVDIEHKCDHENYEFERRNMVGGRDSNKCRVAYYEIPPLKSAFPYHYHTQNEEFYFIVSGEGIVRTPLGEDKVKAGDFVFFPANENGAHKITNTSKTDKLVYIDFDTHNDLEVAVYPDSDKIGVWGKGINKVFLTKKNVDYYEGE